MEVFIRSLRTMDNEKTGNFTRFNQYLSYDIQVYSKYFLNQYLEFPQNYMSNYVNWQILIYGENCMNVSASDEFIL